MALIENLYDLQQIEAVDTAARKAFGDSFAGKPYEFTDTADNGAVLGRVLTAVDPKIFEKRYAELTFLNGGVVVSNIGTDLNSIESLRLADIGGFKRANSTDRNGGIIGIEGENSLINVVYEDATSNWTEREARQASIQGYSFVSRLLQAHNSLYRREIDNIGYLGNGQNSGVLNYSGFTSTAAAGAFSTLTAVQMYDEVSGLLQAQFNAVANTPEYKANKVDMPIETFNLLQAELIDAGNGSNITVLRMLQQNYPDVMFNGTSKATTDMVAYSTNEESMIFRIPNPLTISDVTKAGFAYNVQSYFGVAGCDFLEDAAGYKLTGVAA